MLWYPGSEKFSGLARLDQVRTRARRHQPGFTLPKRFVRDLATAAKKDQQMKPAGLGRVSQGRSGLSQLRVKIFAIDRQWNGSDAGGFSRSHLDGFVQMQFPGPAIVVEAVGDVGVLLDFAQRESSSNGVDRACGNI